MAAELLPVLEDGARERKREAGKQHGRGQETLSATLRQASDNGKASEKAAAELTGASPRPLVLGAPIADIFLRTT